MSDHLINVPLLIHAGATWYMVGLIWFVQVVHYPLMAKVSPDRFPDYAQSHQRLTTWIVGPVMLTEAVTACLLPWLSIGSATAPLPWVGIALLALVWASTFAVQVPLHQRLGLGFDPVLWRRLVVSNWVRTAAWTLRGVIALILVERGLRDLASS